MSWREWASIQKSDLTRSEMPALIVSEKSFILSRSVRSVLEGAHIYFQNIVRTRRIHHDGRKEFKVDFEKRVEELPLYDRRGLVRL